MPFYSPFPHFRQRVRVTGDVRRRFSGGAPGWSASVSALAAAGLLATASGVQASELGPIDLNGSGFLSAVAGRVLKGKHDPATDQGYNCPCFISDYAQNGVYESGRVRFAPDSRAGVQGTASVDSGRYAITGQLIARASTSRTGLEWLYATAELDNDWTLQAGRKRLPLFLSSEVQDVGYTLPWIHLPPQLYGWEIVNYNGASLGTHRTIGDWLASAQVLYGNDRVSDSGYWNIYNGNNSRTATRWNDILGTEVKLSRDWFEVRGVYIQSTTQNRQTSTGQTEYSPRAQQKIYGVSLSADSGPWLARGELLYIDRHEDYGYDHAQLYSLGRRFGPLTALVSYSNYRQTVIVDPLTAEAHSTRSAVLRYDFGASMAVKLQFDLWRDKTSPAYSSMHGDARLISVGFDKVF